MTKKLLIVEDEKMLADMYKQKLELSGFKVFSAYDAEEGFKVAKKVKPDLILLDMLLPRENGIGLLGKIRKEAEISRILVIAFSNYDDAQTKKEAAELGAKDYLIKTNHTPQEVVAKIKEYLG